METINHGQIYAGGDKKIVIQPVERGWSEEWRANLFNLTLPAGLVTLPDTIVPAGQILVVENIAIRYVGTVTNIVLAAGLVVGGIQRVIFALTNPADGYITNTWRDYMKSVTIAPGEYIQFFINPATLNDQAYMHVLGRRIYT